MAINSMLFTYFEAQ